METYPSSFAARLRLYAGEVPELPEVETLARSLAPRLRGRRILRVRILAPRIAATAPRQLSLRLRGRIIAALSRKGKYLLLSLDDGSVLTLHLGMTGSLRWNGRCGPHTRALFWLEGGRLLFDDPRQFGRIRLDSAPPAPVAQLGPDALEITPAEFVARLRQRRGRIKSLLMDQRVLAGVGNIYADEALFRARIHPAARPADLSLRQLRQLHRALSAVLREAIAAGGSSVSDYVDADGRPGWFQFAHRVYRRTGLPCPRCRTPIRRMLIAQRGTHYCPRCQPL